MLAEDDVGPRKAPRHAVVDHGLRTLGCFLPGLEHRHNRAFPCITMSGEQRSSAGKPGNMHVMTARVHHRHRLAAFVRCRRVAAVGKAGGLLHRQCIHVGAKHDGGTLAVAQDADDARHADAGGDLVARCRQSFCREPGRPRLMHRELRMGMNVPV